MVYFLILQAENSSPAYCQFAVSHLLQTHSLNNDPTDRKTQVWGCEFEPDPEREGKECMFFSRSDCQFSLLAATHPCKLVARIWC